MKIVRKRITIGGTVQGVGFRPCVWQWAHAAGLGGWVRNLGGHVELEVQGNEEAVRNLLERLTQRPPHGARVESVATVDLALQGESTFEIRQSLQGSELPLGIAPDFAPCEACLSELWNSNDRRHLYPFVTCAACGPRYSLLESLPYDRANTSMKAFPMCSECRREFEDPSDRRYHAQTNACWRCGPQAWWLDGNTAEESQFANPLPQSIQHVLTQFQMAIDADRIVAVKGVGGFHLYCDASSDRAVRRLRERKGRAMKPLAMLVANLSEAERCVRLSRAAAIELASSARPIVIAERRETRMPSGASSPSELPISACVAPGQSSLGVMLPSSPLHHLLLRAVGRPLIATSANRSEEPIVHDNVEAMRRLSDIADHFLLHNRPIVRPSDDSVVRGWRDGCIPIRISRGYAPRNWSLPHSMPDTLAVGGELKSALCMVRADRAFVSQHLGDMESMETHSVWQRTVAEWTELMSTTPRVVVSDRHPDYHSTRCAQELAKAWGASAKAWQHHHAHLAALAAEHDWSPDRALVGFVLDGTGWGEDGTVWGGEVLRMQGARCERLAHWTTIRLPGGDSAARHPCRSALAYLSSAGLDWSPHLAVVRRVPETERMLIASMLERGTQCVTSSSTGRLFDAVAAILGLSPSVDYEGQAAMELESLAWQHSRQRSHSQWGSVRYPVRINSENATHGMEHQPMLRALVGEVLAGVDAGSIALEFHRWVAASMLAVVQRIRTCDALETIGCTGGVFQNALLLELVSDLMDGSGIRILTHRGLPPNDGNLALGQAWLASASHGNPP